MLAFGGTLHDTLTEWLSQIRTNVTNTPSCCSVFMVGLGFCYGSFTSMMNEFYYFQNGIVCFFTCGVWDLRAMKRDDYCLEMQLFLLLLRCEWYLEGWMTSMVYLYQVLECMEFFLNSLIFMLHKFIDGGFCGRCE